MYATNIGQSWFDLKKHSKSWAAIWTMLFFKLQISYKLALLFHETCSLKIACVSQEMLWRKFCLYLLSHLTTLPICKMSCCYVLSCVSMPKEQTLPNWSGKIYFRGRLETKKEQKKNSCWREQMIQACVHSDRLVFNQRSSCHPETSCTLSCRGQNPRITAKI